MFISLGFGAPISKRILVGVMLYGRSNVYSILKMPVMNVHIFHSIDIAAVMRSE